MFALEYIATAAESRIMRHDTLSLPYNESVAAYYLDSVTCVLHSHFTHLACSK